MPIQRSGLKTKFTLLFLFIGIIPLASTSIFFYFTSRSALFENVYREMTWTVDDISSQIEGHFYNTGKDLLLASENIAFKMYFLDPANRGKWLVEQKNTLRRLRGLYPYGLDEACFIASDGREVARIVLDRVSREDELSSDETRSSFFKKAFGVEQGAVFEGTPTISEDTDRWVLPHATPIAVNGKKAAILHFEISMSYFQALLRKVVNPDRGFAFILNDKGEFMAHTMLNMGDKGPFPSALGNDTAKDLRAIYRKIRDGEKAIDRFSSNGKDYYISYRPMNISRHKGLNENRWSIAYVLPGDKIYVERSIVQYSLITIGATLGLIIALANVIGAFVSRPIRELARASERLAAGEMPHIEVRGKDEFATLTKAFNLMVEAVKRRDEALKELAVTDGLTALYNHRHFKAELEKELKVALRYKRPLSLLMMDLDHFKRFNDTYGHMFGDTVLKKAGEILIQNTREVDLAARYGGEEFAVILPETPLENAYAVAERIRQAFEAAIVSAGAGQPGVPITISVGMASLTEDISDADALIGKADAALYVAKETGRNRVFPNPWTDAGRTPEG